MLWVGPSAERERVAAVAARIAGELEDAPPGFLLVRKTGPTPDGFPRRVGVAKKRPLAWHASHARQKPRFQADSPSGWSLDWPLMPGKVYAFANQKGGVGKTTTAINLAACLAEAGERALVVDLDPQANATSGLGMRANGTSTYDLLDGAPLSELAKPTRFENLFLVPSRPELAGAAVELSQRDDGDRYLAEALQHADGFDFVLLDCPPSLGALTVNALAAADRVIVPVQTEYYALEGLAQLVQSINMIKTRLNPKLSIAGVLLTMADSRTRLSTDVEAEVRKHFGDLVFSSVVPRSVRVAEAPSHGLPVTHYDRRSRGAEAYWKVAMELVERP